MLNIALFSPNQNPYSETFIQAQKNTLPGNVFYYYGTHTNIKLEHGNIDLNRKSFIKKVVTKFYNPDPLKTKWNPLVKSLKSNNIDVILIEYGAHAHNLLPFLKYTDIPFVVHFHGYDATVDIVLEQTNKYKEVFQKATKIIAVSNYMYTHLHELGCPKDKLVYNVYGPNNIFLKVTPQFCKNQLIAIGRFADKKAPYFTVMAFAKAYAKVPDARLIMMGDGALLNACENIAKYLKVAQAISFLGVVPPETFSEYLTTSRAFVQHSLTSKMGDMEGTPLAVLEASAAGLPVISTYHAGIPDVVVHQETGLLCDEGDVDTMAAHMIQILTDKEAAQKMGGKAKDRIKAHFTMDRHIEALYKILEDASR